MVGACATKCACASTWVKPWQVVARCETRNWSPAAMSPLTLDLGSPAEVRADRHAQIDDLHAGPPRLLLCDACVHYANAKQEERVRDGLTTRLRSSPAGQGASAPPPGSCSARRARASRWSTATRRDGRGAGADWRAVPGAQVTGIVADVGREEAAAQRVSRPRAKRSARSRCWSTSPASAPTSRWPEAAQDLGPHHRRQSLELRLVHQRRDRGPARLRARQHRQHLVHAWGQSARRHGAIRRHQGRHHLDDQDAGVRGGEARRARQRGLPGRDADAVPPPALRSRGPHAQDIDAEGRRAACSAAGPTRARSPIRSCGSPRTKRPMSPARC